MNAIVVLVVLLVPLVYAVTRAGILHREDYLFYAGRTPFLQTLSSVICGNIGIGTFVALLLFTAQSPVLGHAIALAYAAGLLLCAALAGRIHAAAQATRSFGLVDYIVRAHGVRHPLAVWIPVALVFGLRTTVQLLALSLIVQIALGLPPGAALFLGGGVVALYTAIGGYRIATETDLPQALVLLACVAVVLWGLAGPGAAAQSPAEAPAFWTFGPWGPSLLVGIMVFLPVTAVLGIDNWQRIATSDTPQNARRAFLVAAIVCGAVYLVLAQVGRVSGAGGDTTMGEVIDTFRALMPQGWGWVADVMIMVAVMSSMDTYVMPLMTTLARTDWSLIWIRAAVLSIFAALVGLSYVLGDVLVGVIAAFNTLVVFLPAVLGALLLGDHAPRAAVVSMGAGVVATLALTVVAQDQAAMIGFALSAGVYAALRPRRVRS
jgi:Na+/proline symporter